MPIIKSAIKKVRKDKTRTLKNRAKLNNLKKLIKQARVLKNDKALTAAFSALDKAAKINLIHRNKASRLKSTLSKLIFHTSSGTKTSSKRKSAKAAPKRSRNKTK